MVRPESRGFKEGPPPPSLDLVLSVACPTHGAPIGEPCWIGVRACCGSRVLLALNAGSLSEPRSR